MTRLHASPVSRRWGLALAALLLLALPSRGAAEAVGTLATSEGLVELGRGETWTDAATGTALEVGDAVRTGRPGRARIVFRDESVMNVGEDSEIVIDEQLFAPAEGTIDSVYRLLRGKVRTLVSEYYKEPTARFEVQTDTSVSGVRGTDFIVSYDPDRKVTEVVGITGEVAVQSVLIPVGETVYIHSQEITTVARGQYPAPARRLEDDEFRRYLKGMQFVGSGLPESAALAQPVLGGGVVPPPDRAGPVTASLAPGSTSSPMSIIAGPTGAVPGDDRNSTPDVGELLGEPPAAVIPPTSGDVGIPF
jgi:hypothetical protein